MRGRDVHREGGHLREFQNLVRRLAGLDERAGVWAASSRRAFKLELDGSVEKATVERSVVLGVLEINEI